MARTQSVPPEKRSKQLKNYYKNRWQRTRDKLKDDMYGLILHMMKAKGRDAKRKGLEFDLDEEWLQKQPMMCAVTGEKFVASGHGQAGRAACSPSFDQIKPGGGYTKTNTRLVCLWYNLAKRDWADEDILPLIFRYSELRRGVRG